MRWLLFLFAIGTLGLSAFSAWLFFGGPEDDPTRARLDAHRAEIQAMLPRAESGEVMAEVAVADLYRKKVPGGDSTPEKAFQWYSKAAKRGSDEAQYALGTMYEKGEGVGKDYFRAAEWYRLAANMGDNADAELALGDFHFHGRGAAHDPAEARDWYRKAAEQGQPVAQYRLGAMILEGWAGEPDLVEAHKWLSLALRHKDRLEAEDPPLDAEKALARVAAKMTGDQLKRAREAARNWRPRR